MFFVLFCFVVTFLSRDIQFIALDPDSGICVTLPVGVTGTFVMDTNGNFDSSAAFTPSKALYVFQLTDYLTDPEGYATFIDTVRDIVLDLSTKSPKFNLLDTLMHWSSYAYKYIDEEGNVQFFRFNGNPLSIFNRFYQTGVISDASDDCDVPSTVSFDPSTGRMALEYSYSAFTNSSACVGAVDPNFLGYNPEIDGDKFAIHFDSRSLVTAYALNNDIMMMDILELSEDPLFTGKTITCLDSLGTPGCPGDVYSFYLGQDPDLPGMDPVVCLQPVTRMRPDSAYFFTNLCTVKVVDQYVYPFAFHFGIAGNDGYNPFIPRRCDCDNGDGKDPYCNDFDIIVGFIQYEAAESDPMLAFHYLLDMAYRYDNTETNTMVYDASFAALRVGE